MAPPPRPNLAPARKASLNNRLSKTRQDATGATDAGSGTDNDDDSDSSASDDDGEEEEDVDEKLMLEKFKDQCWIELTAANLSDDIASLTKGPDSSKSSNDSSGDNIIVGFRVRPPRSVESVGDAPAVSTRGKEVRIERPTLQGAAEKHTFAFDFTFGAKSRQFDVFRDLGWPCVKNAWSGYNVSIFAYGQTGSGKSHSMMGTEKNPGLIRSVGDFIFDFLERSERHGAETGFDVSGAVTVSCLEIYNEQIRDILAPFMESGGLEALHQKNGTSQGGFVTPAKGKRPSLTSASIAKAKTPGGGRSAGKGGVFTKGASALGVKSAVERAGNLKIRETAAKGVYVEGLVSCPVHTVEELSACIAGATGHRETRATNMNAESSRSHLIFTLELENTATGNSTGFSSNKNTSMLNSFVGATMGKSVSKRSKLNLIDLAGSERSKATGATGDSLKEGANINKSLSTLGRVIAALSSQGSGSKSLPPFRDSKLTYILKDALAGNARTSMLATCHASALYYEETVSTLRYASSVKRIKTSATLNAEAEAGDIIAELRAEVVKLSSQLLAAQAERRESDGQSSGWSPGGGHGDKGSPNRRSSSGYAGTPGGQRRASLLANVNRRKSAVRRASAAAHLGGVVPGEEGMSSWAGGTSLDDSSVKTPKVDGPDGRAHSLVHFEGVASPADSAADGSQVSLPGAATPHGEESANSDKPPPSAKATPRRGSSWLPHMLRDEGRKSRADEDEERDLELAAILCERDELDLQLSLRNKERVQLELQLKAKAKELGKLETGLESQTAEVDDLVFALEASNTENKYLHDEIMRLKRKSRQSLNDITNADRDPKTFMKEQVVTALTSYQSVRQRNENKEQDHAALRKHMMEAQSDPEKIIEGLATNMGFWLLEQASGGTIASNRGSLQDSSTASSEGNTDGETNSRGSSSGSNNSQFEEILAALGSAAYEKRHSGNNMKGTSSGGDGGEDGEQSLAETVGGAMAGAVQKRTTSQVELLRQQLEQSEHDKAIMEEQLKLTETKVGDLSENLREFSHVRLELEEQLAAQQMLLQGALKVMGGRDLVAIDAWLATAAELGVVETHEAQTVQRLRNALAEDQDLLSQLEELSDAVEAVAVEVDSSTLEALTKHLAAAAGRGFTVTTHPQSVGRATNAQRSLRHRADALAALNLAISANDELLVQRALGEALKCPGVRHDHPTVVSALDVLSRLEQVTALERRLSAATTAKDKVALNAEVAAAEALGLTAQESPAVHAATLTLSRLEGAQGALTSLDAALASGSLEALQHALEAASRAGVDFETCDAAARAAQLVGQQTSVAQALKGAISARSKELLDGAISRATDLLATPPPKVLSVEQMKRSESESSDLSNASSSLPLQSLVERSESGLEQGQATIAKLLEDAQALRDQLRNTTDAERALEAAVHARNLPALQTAVAAAEEAGVGTTGEVAAGLLHSAKLLCSKMAAEAAATSALLAAVETGDDPAALNHALHAAAALELKGSPAVAAAQTVLLELTAVHRLRMASAHADPAKLVEAVAEAKALTASAAAQPAKKSVDDDGNEDSIDEELAKAPSTVDPEHYRLNSVATAVFATVNGGRTRKSLAMLEQNMAAAEEEVAARTEAEKQRRENEAQLAVKMLDPKLVEEQIEALTESLAETAALLEELMGLKVVLQDLEHQLPPDLLLAFQTGEFVDSCNERFDELATSEKGAAEGLTPDELFPVILEMTQNAPWEITWEQCVKFADIFDADGNGVIDREEFVGFSKFMIVGSMLESMAELGDALRSRTASQGGEVKLSLVGLSPEEVIERVAANKEVLNDLLPLLPEDVYNYLTGPAFETQCQIKFDEVDADGSGDLDPDELVPIILEAMQQNGGQPPSHDLCVQFCQIFDDDGNGVLDREEFVALHRFVVLMATLEAAQQHDVRKHPASNALAREEQTTREADTARNTAANKAATAAAVGAGDFDATGTDTADGAAVVAFNDGKGNSNSKKTGMVMFGGVEEVPASAQGIKSTESAAAVGADAANSSANSAGSLPPSSAKIVTKPQDNSIGSAATPATVPRGAGAAKHSTVETNLGSGDSGTGGSSVDSGGVGGSGDDEDAPVRGPGQMKDRRAESMQRSLVLRREMQEASDRLTNIDAEMETLMGKFESTGAEYGKGLERKRAAVALRSPRPKSAAPPARRPIVAPPPSSAPATAPATTTASSTATANHQNTAATATAGVVAPTASSAVNTATSSSLPDAAISPVLAVRTATTPQRSPRMERPVLARKPPAPTAAADTSKRIERSDRSGSTSKNNSVNRKNSRSQSPSIIRRSPQDAVRLSSTNSNGSIHSQQQQQSANDRAPMTPPRDSQQKSTSSTTNSPQAARPSVPRPGLPSLQPRRNAAASPLRPLPNPAPKSNNAEGGTSDNNGSGSSSISDNRRSSGSNDRSNSGRAEPPKSSTGAPSDASATELASGAAADYGVSDRVYRLVHGSNRPSMKRSSGQPPPPRTSARPLVRDSDRSTTPNRARSEGPAPRLPPPARPPAPRLPPPALAAPSSSSSSSSPTTTQPLLPPTPPLRQQPPPSHLSSTPSSSASSQSAGVVKSGSVQGNRKSRDSNSSVRSSGYGARSSSVGRPAILTTPLSSNSHNSGSSSGGSSGSSSGKSSAAGSSGGNSNGSSGSRSGDGHPSNHESGEGGRYSGSNSTSTNPPGTGRGNGNFIRRMIDDVVGSDHHVASSSNSNENKSRAVESKGRTPGGRRPPPPARATQSMPRPTGL